MITKGQYYDVVHLSKVDKLTTSQIAKKVNLDKKTVTKWLDTEGYVSQTRSKKDKLLDDYQEEIRSLLGRCDYSAVQIFQIIKENGYKGSLSLVREFLTSRNEGCLLLDFFIFYLAF